MATPIVARWPPRDWLLVMCDVGQGDALLVAAGPGRAVVVDTGPDPVRVDRCLRSMGVREVPLVILTHPHFDHVGGLDGVFRGREVGAVVVTPQRAEGRESARLSDELARRRVVEWAARPGASWRLGPSELTILGPRRRCSRRGRGGAAVNNASVVVHVRWAAGAALLSGDVETEAQTALLRRACRGRDFQGPSSRIRQTRPGLLRGVRCSCGADQCWSGQRLRPSNPGDPGPAEPARCSRLPDGPVGRPRRGGSRRSPGRHLPGAIVASEPSLVTPGVLLCL
ncbi:ComEC/Rec2 family competence protein [Streptosporangium lutulentum]